MIAAFVASDERVRSPNRAAAACKTCCEREEEGGFRWRPRSMSRTSAYSEVEEGWVVVVVVVVVVAGVAASATAAAAVASVVVADDVVAVAVAVVVEVAGVVVAAAVVVAVVDIVVTMFAGDSCKNTAARTTRTATRIAPTQYA